MARRNPDSTIETTRTTIDTTDMHTTLVTLTNNAQLSMRIIDKNDLKYSCYQDIIGKGGFGNVYLGHYLHTEVAIKVVRVPGNEIHLISEILALDRIRHPNFIFAIAAAIDTTHCFIVMEHFKSDTLRALISDEKLYSHLTDQTKDYLMRQICNAIDYLHQPKYVIVHGDLKPENILVDYKNQVKICDLGSSFINCTTLGSVQGDLHHHRGTTMYTAPELFSSYCKITTQSDIWALACVFVEIFTGCLVWPVNSIDQLKDLYRQKKIPQILNVGVDLKETLKQCFDYIPDNRPSIQFLLDICHDRQKMYEKSDESSSTSSHDINTSSDSPCRIKDSCMDDLVITID